MLMGPQEEGHSDGDSLGEGGVLHTRTHNRNLNRRCTSNNAGGVPRSSYKEGEDSIHADEDEDGVKYQRQPLGLVLLYLHNASPCF